MKENNIYLIRTNIIPGKIRNIRTINIQNVKYKGATT